LPKLAQLAKGDLAYAVGLMVLLMVGTIGFLPLALPLAVPGVSIDPLKIARSLVLLMLLPLACALAVRVRFSAVAARVGPVLDRISTVSLLVLVASIMVANFKNVLAMFGTFGIFAGLLFIACSAAIGWFLGGPSANTRRVLALGAAQRNIAAALLVAGESFSDPKVTVMVVVVALTGMVILVPLSRWLARRG
jgi:BASS family bile acid:Na+ symporter